MRNIKVSDETLFSLTNLVEKCEKQGIYFTNLDQLIQQLVDEKLKQLEEGKEVLM